MKLKEIKQAVDKGKIVHWASCNYEVIKTYDYLIVCSSNDSVIGLTHKDKVTMNGDEKDFFRCIKCAIDCHRNIEKCYTCKNNIVIGVNNG
jgi:hypothetical protein